MAYACRHHSLLNSPSRTQAAPKDSRIDDRAEVRWLSMGPEVAPVSPLLEGVAMIRRVLQLGQLEPSLHDVQRWHIRC